MSDYNSILAPYIIGLIEEKHSLGFVYHTEELILARFDRYCIQKNLDSINVSKEFIDKWCLRTEKERLTNQRKRISALRQLMLYMISLGINVYLPKFNGKNEIVLPHIFTAKELQAFFFEVDRYDPVFQRSTDIRLANEYRILFRLLYCCGLRNSEGCNIEKDQIDLDNGLLTILDSKGNKDRLVYLADDLLEVCRKYYIYLCNELQDQIRWFFPGKNPKDPLRNTTVDRVFNRFWSRTDFSSHCNNKPTVHDLRFTFVTDRIDMWAMQGVSTELMMPYLQRYIGHKNLQDSYYYYHTSRQLYDAIRIKDKTSNMVIPEVNENE